MKTISKVIAVIGFVAGTFFAANQVNAADGYLSSDVKYAKVCVGEARLIAAPIAEAYRVAAGYDYEAELKLVDPSFPAAFRNPTRKEQFIHPIQFKVAFLRGFETQISVMYSNASADGSGCVFQGIEFLDLTDAN